MRRVKKTTKMSETQSDLPRFVVVKCPHCKGKGSLMEGTFVGMMGGDGSTPWVKCIVCQGECELTCEYISEASR